MPYRSAKMENVTGTQHAAGVSAEASQDERTFTAEIFGNFDAAGDREIGAATRARRAAEFEQRSGGHRDRLPASHGSAVEARTEIRAGDCDRGVAGDAKGGSHDRNFESGRTLVITHELIGGAECP